MKKSKLRLLYLTIFIILVSVEVLIAVFLHEGFIRNYGGDIIVVWVLYSLVRIIIPKKIKLLPIWIFIFSVSVEFMQYIQIVDILHIQNVILRTIIGTSFSWVDILCYFVGCVPLGVVEFLKYKRKYVYIMKNYKAVLFDLDGTLLDTSAGVIDCIKLTIDKLNLKPLSMEDILKFIGPPLQNSFKDICHLNDDMVDLAVKTFRSLYVGDNLFNVKIYDGIFQTLEYLQSKGVKIAVATYKQESFAKNLLEHVGIAKYCNYIYGSDPKGLLTKADIVEKCILSFNEDKSNVVLIGDSQFDAIGSKNANVDLIGVTYGFGFKSKKDVDEFSNVFSADNVYQLLEEFKKIYD